MAPQLKLMTCILVEFYRQQQSPDAWQIPEFNVKHWEQIFFHCYADIPQDRIGFNRPAHFRAGSTDPRWDMLLHEHGGLRARRIAIRWLRRRQQLPQSQEEAA